jgi:hypothetical protein
MTLARKLRGTASVCLMLLWLLPASDNSLAETRVRFEIGSSVGSTCSDTPPDVVVAGSMGLIGVTVEPYPHPEELQFSGFPETQPAWLRIECGYATAVDQELVPSQDLLDLMNPTYIVD